MEDIKIEMIKKAYRQKMTACVMAVVATVNLTSCSDSYPGLEYSGNNSVIQNEEAYDKTPIMVFINPQNFFSVVATRSGTGPFTDLENKKYEKSKFYVFAFRGTTEAQGPLAGKEIDLTKTRMYGDPKEDPDAAYCLVDGEDDYNYGFPAKLTPDYPGAFDFVKGKMTADGTNYLSQSLFYSHVYQEAGYNFFAYHIDNLDNTAIPHRGGNKNEISYDVTIDGTQDVMCGYAPALTGEVLDSKQNISSMTKEERDKVLNIGLYSTFAAHRGVNPVVNLEHQFVQLKFKAYPGDEESDRITITGIDVKAPNRGTLVVANANPHEPSDNNAYRPIGYYPNLESLTDITLKDNPVENGGECAEFTPLDNLKWKPEYKGLSIKERQESGVDVGGSVMIPSPDSFGQEGYDITLRFRQKRIDNDGNETDFGKELKAEYHVALSAGEFQRGKIYTISIMVYGLKQIAVSANIDMWKDEDDPIEVDDDDPEISEIE